MFDSHLNWSSANTMLATPWVLPTPTVNTPPENTCHMIVQVQTQSSGFAGNPEGSLLSTNRIEWFSTGNPAQCLSQPITSTTLLDPESYKTTSENALVAYNGNNPFIGTANNTLIALPPAPTQPNIVPPLLTLSAPNLDIPKSFILQAAGLMDPLLPRPLTHDQSSCVTRIIRAAPDAYAVVQQGPAPVANIMSTVAPNFNQCIRLPLIGGSAMPQLSPAPVANTSQTTWVMVVPPNKSDALIEPKVETESYIVELPSTCSSCGVSILNQSSQLTQDTKCSNCIEADPLSLQCQSANSGVQIEVANDITIKESSCVCQNEGEKSFSWNNISCGKCVNVSTLAIRQTYESDANCQTISTTTVESVEAGIQASEVEPCLQPAFDCEHEEFEPTSQAINNILRKLLEEEIENNKDTKNLDLFNIQGNPMENVSFIDFNNAIDDECDTPTTGVKDVLMTEAPSACTKRRYGGTQSSAKKVRTVLDSTQRRPTCSKCGSKFSSTLNLRKHYMDHENEKSYECGKCKQTFTGCYSYKRHSWTHEKDAECRGDPTGTSIFSESSEEEGIQPYGCAQCGKEFSDSFLLTEHCAKHVRGKPFSCTQCEMCFESVVLLEKHSKVHVRTKTVLFNGYEAESESSSESQE